MVATTRIALNLSMDIIEELLLNACQRMRYCQVRNAFPDSCKFKMGLTRAMLRITTFITVVNSLLVRSVTSLLPTSAANE